MTNKFVPKMKCTCRYLLLAFINILFANPFYGQYNESRTLNAILIVGHQEDGTRSAIDKMDDIADLLLNNGIAFYKFYDNRADWDHIVETAKHCHFLIYSGHGSTMGPDGNVGGLCINSMVSSAELINNLRLKENALVIFKSVCNGAGSSAGDDFDIGLREAKKRVAYYAYPFFEIGVSGYYANNLGNGVLNFLKYFLAGTSLKEAFYNSAADWTEIEFEGAFPFDDTKLMSIASNPGGGFATRTTYTNGVKKVEKVISHKSYDIAYAGFPHFTIADMYGN